jgi:hypothetical protein
MEVLTKGILEDRGSSHGPYEDQGTLAALLKSTVRGSPRFHNLPWYVQDAIDMILVKISRAVCGKWDFADHWDDIVGYATLVANAIKPRSE